MKLGNFELDNIYCVDSYKAIKDIPDKSVDCIYTDIPYLFDEGGAGKSDLGLRLAKRKATELKDIIKGIDYLILDDFVRIMKNINCFIWCSKSQIPTILNYFLGLDKDITFDILVWAKSNPIPATNNTWLPDLEYCLNFREKSKVKLNDDYSLKSKWYDSPINKKDKDKFTHPTIKPKDLVERHIKHTTQEGDIIFDPFSGSGTTCAAAKDTKRHWLGFDIEQKWVDISNNRLNNIDANGQTSMFTF